MPSFVPCAGKSACTEDGSYCRGCGRSHDEIARARDAINVLADLAFQKGYDDVEVFAEYVAARIVKKVENQRSAAV